MLCVEATCGREERAADRMARDIEDRCLIDVSHRELMNIPEGVSLSATGEPCERGRRRLERDNATAVPEISEMRGVVSDIRPCVNDDVDVEPAEVQVLVDRTER